jgi:hypothetical protein
VVVDDFHIKRVAGLKSEADPPLVIDTDAVLTSTVAFSRLQSIIGRHP